GHGGVVGTGVSKANDAPAKAAAVAGAQDQSSSDTRLWLAVAREKIRHMREKASSMLLNKVPGLEPNTADAIIGKLNLSKISGLGQPGSLAENPATRPEKSVAADEPGISKVNSSETEHGGEATLRQLASTEASATQLETKLAGDSNVIGTLNNNLTGDGVTEPEQPLESDANLATQAGTKPIVAGEPGASQIIDGKFACVGDTVPTPMTSTDVPTAQIEPILAANAGDPADGRVTGQQLDPEPTASTRLPAKERELKPTSPPVVAAASMHNSVSVRGKHAEQKGSGSYPVNERHEAPAELKSVPADQPSISKIVGGNVVNVKDAGAEHMEVPAPQREPKSAT
ncbi:hypothetical protein HDU96_005257, partial [Phlyctochytrium bullatum]